ncbi:CPBP family intramembrane metalloprotease [Clostridium sp. 19966]|uniref:CPBP family intramembrane glutamic endopeptidase n=1 Tax=Clostridium sp. 19966 TaxID=2768166 RepID=UPI0028DFB35A|nr:CPBP family intramembrane glutamic endopeptidase [Clostridium sp. 19966]MDT8718283.1 CPBP family intramembrane metalloprotease [Clostridium sp. 19966]
MIFMEIGTVVTLLVIFFQIIRVVSGKSEHSFIYEIGLEWHKNSFVDIIFGIIIGFIVMLGIFIVESKLSFVSINDISIRRLSAEVLINILVMAMIEEVVFRGLVLKGLISITKNKSIAVFISAILFGLAHADNPHANAITVISNSLGGAMYAIAYLESKSLYFSIAIHFSWNYFQGPIFGFPVSGFNFPGVISQSVISSNITLMGGMYGPEGGIIGIGFRLVVIMLIFAYGYFIDRNKKGAK